MMLTYGKLPYRSYYIYHLDFYDLYKNGEILDKTLVLNLKNSTKIFNNTFLNKLDRKVIVTYLIKQKKPLIILQFLITIYTLLMFML